jgi:hypothetical protein
MNDTPAPDEDARIRRNRLVGRIAIIGLGLLVLAQMSPLLIRWAQGHPF